MRKHFILKEIPKDALALFRVNHLEVMKNHPCRVLIRVCKLFKLKKNYVKIIVSFPLKSAHLDILGPLSLKYVLVKLFGPFTP